MSTIDVSGDQNEVTVLGQTNAQVALSSSARMTNTRWQRGAQDVINDAKLFLNWLNDNTPKEF